ncbi:AMP-binding protein, partial [Hyphococcus sp.]|uniref:AMP-binding protein n=1 Tax=Hyphococcus sp. TaxID=2038636 RepID=UPI003750CA2B
MGDPVKRIERRSRRAIFQAYLDNARKEKSDKLAVTDGDGRKLSLQEITRGAFALGGALGRLTAKDERVGILLPTGAGAIIALFALLSRGRVPAMLNFTAGSKNLRAACKAAQVTKIVTAKKFIELAGLENLISELSTSLEIIHLEDVREQIKPRDKALALLGPIFPTILAATPDPESPGVILFT